MIELLRNLDFSKNLVFIQRNYLNKLIFLDLIFNNFIFGFLLNKGLLNYIFSHEEFFVYNFLDSKFTLVNFFQILFNFFSKFTLSIQFFIQKEAFRILRFFILEILKLYNCYFEFN